ncbi:hypothetical protein B5K06_27395 [Rhizobium grahamii]|uniref:Transposase n=1 Tax=Rhizobium grahamii TaxID=1120045 RepID=A0A370KH76_9HYPH|nr:hypothetical protein B5K06_27395 [Rhizobium grahamii]
MVWRAPASAIASRIVGMSSSQGEEPSMSQLTTVRMERATTEFQIHAVDENGRVLVRRQLRRGQLLSFFEKHYPCLIGMEACAAHRVGLAGAAVTFA